MGFIISVCNNKGGVGKTTASVNLADALGRDGKRVLVVDMDSQCNATGKLLPSKTQIEKSLYDILDPDQTPFGTQKIIYQTGLDRVDLLPNIAETSGLEPKLILGAPETFTRLREILRDRVNRDYDFTIVDCPPNLGTFVLIALYMADFALVPVKAGSSDSIDGLVRAIRAIEEVSSRGNPDLRFLRLLINHLDKRTAISKSVAETIANIFPQDQVFKTIIPVNTTFERAEAKGLSVFQIDTSSTGAVAYRDLSRELLSILG